jgi:hypothetical protein
MNSSSSRLPASVVLVRLAHLEGRCGFRVSVPVNPSEVPRTASIVDFRTRLAKMHEAEIKTALAAKSVVRVSQVLDVFTAHLADASLALQSVKGRVMAYMEKLGVPRQSIRQSPFRLE